MRRANPKGAILEEILLIQLPSKQMETAEMSIYSYSDDFEELVDEVIKNDGARLLLQRTNYTSFGDIGDLFAHLDTLVRLSSHDTFVEEFWDELTTSLLEEDFEYGKVRRNVSPKKWTVSDITAAVAGKLLAQARIKEQADAQDNRADLEIMSPMRVSWKN